MRQVRETGTGSQGSLESVGGSVKRKRERADDARHEERLLGCGRDVVDNWLGGFGTGGWLERGRNGAAVLFHGDFKRGGLASTRKDRTQNGKTEAGIEPPLEAGVSAGKCGLSYMNLGVYLIRKNVQQRTDRCLVEVNRVGAGDIAPGSDSAAAARGARTRGFFVGGGGGGGGEGEEEVAPVVGGFTAGGSNSAGRDGAVRDFMKSKGAREDGARVLQW
ncbi:hypothetical protein CLOM_g509 [Closterium sp. NIES-68]|nr:hypothetical protein CLOM_g509 [Closterium sp. NIES-68]GJP69203.1 hypothetical protein CLOP_g153 [Closterium sp. NIES-67]